MVGLAAVNLQRDPRWIIQKPKTADPTHIACTYQTTAKAWRAALRAEVRLALNCAPRNLESTPAHAYL